MAGLFRWACLGANDGFPFLNLGKSLIFGQNRRDGEETRTFIPLPSIHYPALSLLVIPTAPKGEQFPIRIGAATDSNKKIFAKTVGGLRDLVNIYLWLPQKREETFMGEPSVET